VSPSGSAPLVVNSWTLFAHPLFLDQLDVLIRKVESLRRKDPATYRQKNATKRLAAIRKLIFEVIPQDPGRAEFRQGKALGEQHTHWFRAKFFQQYRLFFRYHASSKIIVYAWVNDASTLRAYESKSDAYRVFRRMLDSGNPPDDWETLLVEAERAKERFRRGS
tara:strand:- start:877 stop:1368 length:492 start_codon:yes stop_codon:yes gene_type:complete